MSRCRACNNVMTDVEMRRKDPNTKDFTDLCTTCFVSSVQTLVEMDGYINDIDTIQLMEEMEVDITENRDKILGIYYNVDNNEDNY